MSWVTPRPPKTAFARVGDRHTTLEICHCPRCGFHHEELIFMKVTTHSKEYTHSSSCPETAQPILVNIRMAP